MKLKKKKYDIMPNQKTGTIPLYKKLKAGIIALFAKDKNQHRESLLKAGAILATVPAIVFSVTACQVETEESHELVQKSVETFTSVSEFEEECEKIYSVQDKVIANIENTIKNNYGKDTKICSIYYDWKDKFDGDVFAIVNINDKIEVLKFSNEINIEDISKITYKNGTYKLEDNILKFYTYLGENSLDLTNQKFYVEEETGDLILIENFDSLDAEIKKSFGKFEQVNANLSNNLDIEKQNDAKYAMQYFLQSDTETLFLNTSLSYDENQDKTIYSVSYLSSAKTYNLIKFEFSGNVVTENGLLDKDKAEEQFKYYEVKTSGIKTNTVATAPVALIKEDLPQTLEFSSNQEYIDNENLPPEQIEINSWEELFNVFGEENSFLIKDKILELIKNSITNSKKLYSELGNNAGINNVETLKLYLDFEGSDLLNIKVLCRYKFSDNQFSIQIVTFSFFQPINYKDFDVKLYKKYDDRNDGDLFLKTENGIIVIRFDYLINKLDNSYVENKTHEGSYADPPLNQTKFFNDLLLPLAEKEGLIADSSTLYKNYILKYSNKRYKVEGYYYDSKTQLYKEIYFYLNDDGSSTIEEACQNAVDNGEYEIVFGTEKVITADGIEIDLTDGEYQSASNII